MKEDIISHRLSLPVSGTYRMGDFEYYFPTVISFNVYLSDGNDQREIRQYKVKKLEEDMSKFKSWCEKQNVVWHTTTDEELRNKQTLEKLWYEKEVLEEDLECIKMFLDKRKVPTHDANNKKFSIVGRIEWYTHPLDNNDRNRILYLKNRIARLAGKQRQLKSRRTMFNMDLSTTKNSIKEYPTVAVEFITDRVVRLGRVGREIHQNKVQIKELTAELTKLKDKRNSLRINRYIA